MGKLSVRNSNVLNSESVILPQPTKSTNHLVCKQDLMIFHQNIRGINNKINEILNTVATNPPHVLCFTEHHLNSYQLDNILFQN
jgi:hypothetical protein